MHARACVQGAYGYAYQLDGALLPLTLVLVVSGPVWRVPL